MKLFVDPGPLIPESLTREISHKLAVRLRTLAYPLNGGNNSGRNLTNRPVSIHFRETPQSPIMLDNRRSESRISAHPLAKDSFRVIGALDQRCTLYVAESIPLGRIHEDVIDRCADRTVPASRNSTQ